MEGRKERRGKLRYDLFPPEAMEKIVEVLTYGAEKYTVYGDCTCQLPNTGHTISCGSHKVLKSGDNNWKNVDDLFNTYYAALERHLQSRRKGNLRDKESGLLELAMVATDAIFLLQNEVENLSHEGSSNKGEK